jgi:hypothetical protein
VTGAGALEGLLAHFGVETPGQVTWAHAVNSRRALRDALSDAGTMMVEGDISVLPRGGGIGMAHPPVDQSDLPFDDWIESLAGAGKGAKLDFKDPGAVESCLGKLAAMRRAGRLAIPIVLNADVLPGPGIEQLPARFDGRAWIEQCAAGFEGALLSLGWTTVFRPGSSYSEPSIARMLELGAQAGPDATVCIRACFVRDSRAGLERILATAGHTLTIWNGKADPPAAPDQLRELVDPRRAFFDLIDASGQPLRG